MSGSDTTDSDYPYSSTQAPVNPDAGGNSLWWRAPLRWLSRLAIGGAGLIMLAVMGMGVEIYQSVVRARLVQELQLPAGCSV